MSLWFPNSFSKQSISPGKQKKIDICQMNCGMNKFKVNFTQKCICMVKNNIKLWKPMEFCRKTNSSKTTSQRKGTWAITWQYYTNWLNKRKQKKKKQTQSFWQIWILKVKHGFLNMEENWYYIDINKGRHRRCSGNLIFLLQSSDKQTFRNAK